MSEAPSQVTSNEFELPIFNADFYKRIMDSSGNVDTNGSLESSIEIIKNICLFAKDKGRTINWAYEITVSILIYSTMVISIAIWINGEAYAQIRRILQQAWQCDLEAHYTFQEISWMDSIEEARMAAISKAW